MKRDVAALETPPPFLSNRHRQTFLACRTAKVFVWALGFVWLGVGMARAQDTSQPHNPCGYGQFRDEAGRCAPIEQVLAANGTIYWVDQHHPQASDQNPGTQHQPWKTIRRATRAGVLSPGDAVVVRRGVYREAIRPKVGGRSADSRITFAAYPGETVVITGADPMNTGWTRDGNDWRHTWRLPLPAYPYKNQSVFRREMVIVDGDMMRAVYHRQDLAPGTFFIEGSDTAPRALYLRLPGDAPPNGHQIEVGVRHLLFGPDDGACGADSNLGWFRVVGFVFRHATNRAQWGAICPGNEGSLLEDNTVEWTNGLGIKVSGKNHTLRGNRAIDNGQAGIGGSCTACLLEHNESSRNNWKGYNMFWEAGGGKWSNTRRTTIRFHRAQDNKGPGLWFDRNNAGNIIEQSRFITNLGAGLMLEYQTVRTTVRNNLFYGTRWQQWTGSGVLTQASSHNTIIYNSFIANEGTGLWIRPDPANRAEDGHSKIYNNLFAGNATGAHATGEAREIALARRTNVLDGNLYWSHPANKTFWYGPERWHGDDLETWQALTRGDTHAITGPTSRPVVEDLTTPDGWHLVADSPARRHGVTLPNTVEPVLEDIEGDVRPLRGADVGADQYVAPEASMLPEAYRDSLWIADSSQQANQEQIPSHNDTRAAATDSSVAPGPVSGIANYPNPFRTETVIYYELSKDAHVRIVVYDLTGRRVALLLDQMQQAGRHNIVFRAHHLPSGVYICQVEAEGFRQSRRMSLRR